MLKKILIVVSLVFLLACSEETQVTQNTQPPAEQPTASAPPAPSAPAAAATAAQAMADHYLVFFLDPNGGPCRMQNSILEEMAEELKEKVSLRYVQTTVKEDLQYFYAFGIRGLPSLVLADATGKEIKRLPPGVNPAEKVRELLQAIPN
jgi:thioredoxin 1